MLETVALTHDVPESGLCRGDLSAVVALHAPDAVELEFVAASGRTQVQLTLRTSDVRTVGDQNLLAVRSHVDAGGS